MSPVGITLLMLLGCTGFAVLAWRKLALLAALAPDPRLDDAPARWRSVLRNGLMQQRMLQREWRPGLMHAVIFLGFLALLLRKLQLLAIGYSETAAWPDAFGGPFAALKDGVEIAVLAAVGYALWRRYVLRPRRLEPNREALAVLLLIAVIMLSDLAFDAFRFAVLAPTVAAIAHEQQWAFAGATLSAAVAGWGDDALRWGYHASYWLQMAAVFGFLVLLPWGEHFHIVTALPTLYFRRGNPARQVPAVDLERLMAAEDEADMKAGVRSARDLTWKEGLDVFTCTECGRCKDACPTFLTGKPLSQKAVNDDLKQHLMQQREAIVSRSGELPALIGNVIAPETLWACTSCGYCEAACPIELEHLPRFYRLRQHQVMIEGEFPHELKKAFEAWESQGNAWGLPAQQRGDWARDLGLPVVRSAADMAQLDWLFYVGSAMSYDPRGQKIARAFVRVMQHAGVRVGILGADEGSTGECARRLGNEMLFRQLADALVATLNERGVQRIVTCDPHALNTLRHEFPALGGHYEVVHHSALIAALLRDGRLRLAPGATRRVAFHDPCYLGRHNGEYDAPRMVLAAACGGAPVELALAREKAMCCGAGGGRFWLEETIGQRINVERAQQVVRSGAAAVATACPYCAVMLGDGLKALPPGQDVPVRDIAEWVAEALAAPASGAGGVASVP